MIRAAGAARYRGVMAAAVSPLKALADAIRETARVAAGGVVQVRARGMRPATAAHVGPDLVVAPLHAVDREDGLVVRRGEEAFDAALVGRDESLDLALLRAAGLGASPFTPCAGTCGAAQLVVAVTRGWHGDLAAKLTSVTGETHPVRRWRTEPLPALLRTDLMPVRGISGGVLVDPDGHVVGWLTTGLSRGGVVAVPVGLLLERVDRLATHGRIRKGYVGMAVQPVLLAPLQQASGRHGLLVSAVDSKGPAADAGVCVGDILVAADDQPLDGPGGLLALLSEARIDTILPVRVVRGTTILDLPITIGERER